jgi:hypothetical protein
MISIRRKLGDAALLVISFKLTADILTSMEREQTSIYGDNKSLEFGNVFSISCVKVAIVISYSEEVSISSSRKFRVGVSAK